MRRRTCFVLASLVAMITLCGDARADKAWVGTGTGNWSDPANWSDTEGGPGGAGIPGPGEPVSIWTSDDVNRTISLDVSANIGPLGIAALPQDASTVFNHLSGVDLQTTATTIGGYYGDTSYHQQGGTHTTAFLDIAFSQGRGTYELTGGTLSTNRMDLGHYGYGTFIHSGGTAHVGTFQLARGIIDSGAGTYIMNGAGASLIVDGNETISYRSHGSFIQSAGSHRVEGTLFVGASGGGYATYEMSGGSLTVGSLLIGSGYGTGTFIHSAGTITVGSAQTPGTLHAKSYELWNDSSALSVFGTLSTNLQLSGGRVEFAGGELRSSVTQTGGAFVAQGPFRMFAARYDLAGGTFTAPSVTFDYMTRMTYSGGTLNIGTLLIADGSLTVSQDSGQTLVLNALGRTSGFGMTLKAAVDLTNNNMIIDYDAVPATSMADLRGYLHAGWLASSTADPAHRLGYGDNADPLLQKSSFSGQTFPAGDFSQLLVMYTFGGDANLDGAVDVLDLVPLAEHWQEADAFWTEGDFNYDSLVNQTDLGILAMNWHASEESWNQSLAAMGLPSVPLPEPGMLGLAAVIAIMTRRRPRQA